MATELEVALMFVDMGLGAYLWMRFHQIKGELAMDKLEAKMGQNPFVCVNPREEERDECC